MTADEMFKKLGYLKISKIHYQKTENGKTYAITILPECNIIGKIKAYKNAENWNECNFNFEEIKAVAKAIEEMEEQK